MATFPVQDSYYEDRRLAPLMGHDYYASLAKLREKPSPVSALLTWHLGKTSLSHVVERHFPERTAARINRLSALKVAHAVRNHSTVRRNLAAEREENKEWKTFEADVNRYAKANGGLKILQIGANDGRSNDRLHPLIKAHDQWQITLVEPMDSAFARLRETYKGRNTARLINRAVVDKDGPVTMHYIVPDNLSWENVDTVATTKPETLKSFSAANYQVGETQVEGCTLTTLATNFDISLEDIDLLVIDAEGCDYMILRQALAAEKMRPAFVVAEHDHMQNNEFTNTLDLLLTSGYQPTVLGHDLIARRSDTD